MSDDETKRKELGQAIRTIRVRFDMSLKELSEHAQMKRSTLGEIERGIRPVTDLEVFNLLHGLMVKARPSGTLILVTGPDGSKVSGGPDCFWLAGGEVQK